VIRIYGKYERAVYAERTAQDLPRRIGGKKPFVGASCTARTVAVGQSGDGQCLASPFRGARKLSATSCRPRHRRICRVDWCRRVDRRVVAWLRNTAPNVRSAVDLGDLADLWSFSSCSSYDCPAGGNMSPAVRLANSVGAAGKFVGMSDIFI
jgi:hypothetical protein